MTRQLSEYDCPELVDAKKHIERLIKFSGEEMQKNPGPGWDPVFAMLERDLSMVVAEINRKC